MRNECITIIACLDLILTVIGCAQTSTESKKPIKIGLTVWPGYAYMFIADEKGMFKKNGVDVEFVLSRDTPETTRLYFEGEIDGYANPLAEAIVLNSEGKKTKVVFIIDYSDTGDVIVARPDINSIADLTNRTVSFEGVNTFSHLFVLVLLEKNGLSEGDVKFSNILAQDVPESIDKGIIDAGHTWEPAKTRALEKGYVIVGKAGDVPGIISDVLAFSSKIVEERPQDVKNVIKSMLEAREFYQVNKDEALEIMSRRMNMTMGDMLSGIEGADQPGLEENIDAMKDTNSAFSIFSSGRIIIDFYVKRGQMSYAPQLVDLIDASFVNDIAHERS